MFSEEETQEIKQKLISHIEKTFPPEQIISATEQIKSMNSSQLKNFLEENNIIIKENSNKECVFCSISSEKIHSVKIDENKDAVAVLEINPISKGHTLIIPKEHSEESSKNIFSFAKKIAGKIQKKFNPKKIEFSKSKLFGHETISILPIYSEENFGSAKKQAKIEDLEKIKEELETKKKVVKKQKSIEKKPEFLWLPKRIP